MPTDEIRLILINLKTIVIIISKIYEVEKDIKNWEKQHAGVLQEENNENLQIKSKVKSDCKRTYVHGSVSHKSQELVAAWMSTGR